MWRPLARVEVAGRLVGQHDRRVVGERARERDALLLAARQLRRIVMRAAGQADLFEQLLGPRAATSATPAISIGTATFSYAVSDGIRWKNWKTKPIFSPRSLASASSSSRVMSTPSMSTEPDVGASRPAISPSSVDLPLPDGPTIATNWPRGISSRQRVEDGERLGAARDGLRDLAQLDHDPGRPRCALRFGNRLQHRPDVVGDDARAFGGRMDAVALVQRLDAGDALQQKRHERRRRTAAPASGYTL